jgi:hypothetical protein
VVKTFPFKGGSRLWSNRYHFLGGTPADDTHWHTLMDAVTAVERTCFPAEVVITEAVGYAAGSDVPVSSKVYSIAGNVTVVGGNAAAPGECAGLVRYSTASRTVKNHPIYLFNYYHGMFVHVSGAAADLLDANIKSALATYAAHWISGFSDGSITATRCGPNGQAATGSIVEEYVTHRDFPYTTSV